MTLPFLDWQALPRPILIGGVKKKEDNPTASASLRHRVDIDRMYLSLMRKVGRDSRLCSAVHFGSKGYVVKENPWFHMSQYRIKIEMIFKEDLAGILTRSGHLQRGKVYKGDVGITDNNDVRGRTCHLHADGTPDNVLSLLQTGAALGLLEIDFDQGIFEMIPEHEVKKPKPQRRPWGVPPGHSTEQYVQACLVDLGLAGFAEKPLDALPPLLRMALQKMRDEGWPANSARGTAVERVLSHFNKETARSQGLDWSVVTAGAAASIRMAAPPREGPPLLEAPSEKRQRHSPPEEEAPAMAGVTAAVAEEKNPLEAVAAAREEPPPPAPGYHDASRPELGAMRVPTKLQEAALAADALETDFGDEEDEEDEFGDVDFGDEEAEEAAAMAAMEADILPTQLDEDSAEEAPAAGEAPAMAGVTAAVAEEKTPAAEEEAPAEEEAIAAAVAEEKTPAAEEEAPPELPTVGLDEYFGTWGIKDFALPLDFMKIPEHCAELLLPALQLGSGQGEEIEIAKLDNSIKGTLRELGVVLGEAGERRLSYHICVLRSQHAWLKRERASCIQWNQGKVWPKEGSAFVDRPDGLTQLTGEAVTRYMEDQLWDAYQKSEAVKQILKLDMEVNKTKRKVALNSMRGRYDAYLCEYGGGRRA